jgi:HlyD family secretion protein
MLHKKVTVYIALIGLGATAVMASRMSAPQKAAVPPIEPATNPYTASLAASGIIEALSENVFIGVPEPALVTKVHVQVAETVHEGQPLFTLDDRDLRAQLAVNAANANVAEATLRRWQDQLARLQGVNDPRAVSAEEVRTKENDVAVAGAQLEMARAQVAHTKVRLERMTVLAPRAGTVLQVNIRPGEYAAVAPKVAAMVLGDVEHLQVRADVDEQNAPRLHPGQTGTAYLKGDSSQPIELTFVRIEPYVVPKTSLTGASTERVDTRVLQVIFSFTRPHNRAIYVGQQVDLFVKSDQPAIETRGNSTCHIAKN